LLARKRPRQMGEASMIRAALIAFVALAACSEPTRDQPQLPAPVTPAQEAQTMPRNAAEATARDTCGAHARADFIGQNVSAVTPPPGARVIAPDSVVTQDFRPERLNIITDAHGVIQRLECY